MCLKDHALNYFFSRPSFADLFRALQVPCGVASISYIIHASAPQILDRTHAHRVTFWFSHQTHAVYFLLLKPCHLVTGFFWDAMDSLACLFAVFCYMFTSESTAKPENSTIFDSGLDPENHEPASYSKETMNPY